MAEYCIFCHSKNGGFHLAVEMFIWLLEIIFHMPHDYISTHQLVNVHDRLKNTSMSLAVIDQERDQPAFSEHRNAHPSVHSCCSFIAVHWSTRLHTVGTHEITHFNNIIKSSQRGSKPLHTIISLFVTFLLTSGEDVIR